jgi:hypothetical protein
MRLIKLTLITLFYVLWTYKCFSSEVSHSNSTASPDGGIIINVTIVNPSCVNRIQPTSSSRLGDGSITATATGGTAPYTYELTLTTPPQNDGYFPKLSSGNYQVIVKDALGASASLDVYLADTLPQPMLSMNVLQLPSSCTSADGSCQLIPFGGTPPFTYSIDGGVTYSPGNNIVTNLQQGYYYLFLLKDANGCLAAASPGSSGNINSFMCNFCCYLQISGQTEKPSCNDDGQITVGVNNSPPPIYYSLDGINYQLANGANNNVNTFSNLAAGVYHIYARNADGFITQSTFTVAKACPDNVTFSKINPDCKQHNGSITVTANFGKPPYSYSINGSINPGNNVFTGLQADTYHIIVTDLLGESDSVVVNLLENCPSVKAIPVKTTCNKQDGSITANGSNGMAPYLFSIDEINFQSSNIFNGLKSGDYILTLKDADGNRDSVKITVGEGNCLQVTATAANPTCGNINGAVTVKASNGTAPYQYSKDGINFISDNVFSGLPPGSFTVTVKDTEGSIGVVTVLLSNVPAPSITLSAGVASCNNTNGFVTVTTAGGLPPYQYSINTGTAFQDSTVFNGLDSGQYQVIVKDSNGCTDTSSIRLTALPKPTVFLGNDSTLCNEDSLLLTVPLLADHKYLWQDNSVANSYKITTPGTYAVTITNQYNCTASDTINILYKQLPVFNIGDDTAICSNRAYSLTPSPAVQGIYLWNTGSNAVSINLNTAGNYWLSVNNNGCYFTDSVQIDVKPAPVVNLGNDTTLCEGQALLLNAANTNATYLWQDGSSLPTFSVKSPGTFSVNVELNSCVANGIIVVTYSSKPIVNLVKDT